jgi:hypothetical protein
MFLPRRVSTGELVRAGSCLGGGVCLLCRMFLIDNYNILSALPNNKIIQVQDELLSDSAALRNNQISVSHRGEPAQVMPAFGFERRGRLVVFAGGEFDGVVQAELLEEPGCADGARGLEEVEGYWWHGWR